MSVDQSATFLTLLAMVATGITVTTCVALATDSGRTRLALLGDAPLRLAFAVAATSVAGSLYFSEVAGFTPCELCWYQRIAMYPLAVILAVEVVRPGGNVARFVLPLSIGGAAVSIYHYQLQLFPDQGSSCDPGTSCVFMWVDKFGFFSIPLMALVGFATVATLVVASGKQGGVDRTAADQEVGR
jgi:disulfide bond formation protein DsbB|tara:strand:+ start:56 stop:610 length:555 start_codon:yes stop_codon:yes gene_type:complete